MSSHRGVDLPCIGLNAALVRSWGSLALDGAPRNDVSSPRTVSDAVYKGRPMHSRPCLIGHRPETGCPLASGLGRLLGNPRRQILEPFLSGPRTGEDRQSHADREAQPKQPEQNPEPQSALLCRRWSQAGHAPVFITATGRLGRCLLGVEPRIRGRDGRYRLYWRLRHRRRGNGRCGS